MGTITAVGWEWRLFLNASSISPRQGRARSRRQRRDAERVPSCEPHTPLGRHAKGRKSPKPPRSPREIRGGRSQGRSAGRVRARNPADPAGIAITGVTAGGYWHWRQCVPNWRFCQPSDNALDVDLAKRSDMALVRKRLPASRSRRADRLCSVTLLVPENCAEGLI